MAFEIDYLDDWVMSSYWYPGHSKAESAVFRMFIGNMPPGVWNVPRESEHMALNARIGDWVSSRIPACSTLTPTEAGICIWGSSGTDWNTVTVPIDAGAPVPGDASTDGQVPEPGGITNGDVHQCAWNLLPDGGIQ
jgi:hypothetical protein